MPARPEAGSVNQVSPVASVLTCRERMPASRVDVTRTLPKARAEPSPSPHTTDIPSAETAGGFPCRMSAEGSNGQVSADVAYVFRVQAATG